ncbi:major prion protein homolog [Ambystoma mexicanum]|uniref:major prion protein homolog n=1 Tax=Ambystoma mexicanum TaxID=8296 RepID=UPI0037E96724
MGNRQMICWVLILVAVLWADTSLAKKGGKSKTGGGWGSNTNNRNTGGTWTNWNSGTNNNWNAGGNRGQNYNPQGGGSNFNKQWKPPKSKPNMKMVAGAAVAGALAGGVGGYVLGNAMGRMRYNFDNQDDYSYYNQHSGRMPERVYRPRYVDDRPVTEERFVTDCYNMSAIEYIYKYDDGKNNSDVDPVEARVKSHVITQMCRSEYRMGNGVRKFFSDPFLVMSILLFLYFVVQ